MSKLRRLVLSDRFFFLSCRVLPSRGTLSEAEFGTLAQVVLQRRQAHGFPLTAWVFLPDHWHAIVYPSFPLTISRVMEAIKVGATLRINRHRAERGVLLQGRFFNAGLVRRPQDWQWSSVHDYTGTARAPAGAGSPIPVDRITLPANPRTRI